MCPWILPIRRQSKPPFITIENVWDIVKCPLREQNCFQLIVTDLDTRWKQKTNLCMCSHLSKALFILVSFFVTMVHYLTEQLIRGNMYFRSWFYRDFILSWLERYGGKVVHRQWEHMVKALCITNTAFKGLLSDLLRPDRLPRPQMSWSSLNNSSSCGPSVQTCETLGDISHSNCHSFYCH